MRSLKGLVVPLLVRKVVGILKELMSHLRNSILSETHIF